MKKLMFMLLCAALLPAISLMAQEGSCGANVTWSLENGTLTIDGEGQMLNFTTSSHPAYYIYKDDIKQVVVKGGVSTVGAYSFYECDKIESLLVEEGTQGINQYAFAKCGALESVSLPESLVKIDEYAFNACGIKSLTVPSGLKEIYRGAFYDCRDLVELYWNANVPAQECDRPYNYGYGDFFTHCPIQKAVFGEKATTIPAKLLLDVGGLTEVVTSGTIEYVGLGAFSGTLWLSQQQPGAPLYIDKCLYAFLGSMDGPTEIDIRPGTMGVTRSAFNGQINLTKVTIPESMSYIGRHAFAGCTSLSEAQYNAIDCDYDDDSNQSPLFTPSALSRIHFGENVKSIPATFCRDCTGLKEVVFTDNIEKIGAYAFYHCTALNVPSFPLQLKEIGHNAFLSTAIKNVFLHDNVTTIGLSAFQDCDIDTLVVGKNVEVLGIWAFSSVNTVFFNSTKNPEIRDGAARQGIAEAQNIIFGDDIEITPSSNDFYSYGYFDKTPLAQLVIGRNVKTLSGGNYYAEKVKYKATNAERANVIASEVVIEEGVESLPENFCFRNGNSTATRENTWLKTITFPNSLKTINDRAFAYCTALTEIHCPWYKPSDITVGKNVFANHDAGCVLYVPKGCKERYAALEPWSDFLYIVEEGGTVEKEQCALPVIGYADGKLQFTSATSGVEYHYTITDADMTADALSQNGVVKLVAAYNISVYATRAGYINSETATGTLYFVDAALNSIDAVASASQRAIVVRKQGQTVAVSGLENGETVQAFDTAGTFLGQGQASAGMANINVQSLSGRVLLIKVGNQTVKYAF